MSPRSGRIAVVTPWDVSSPRSWSGVIVPMLTALRDEMGEVEVIAVPSDVAIADRVRARALGMRGALHLPSWSPPTARRRSRAVAQRLEELPSSMPVVALAATPELLAVPRGRRIVQVTDSSFAALTRSYPAYARLTDRGRRVAEDLERRIAGRTEHFLVATAWSADRLVVDVRVPEDTVTVARFGPAIAPVRPVGEKPPHDGRPLRLLLVASDWERKGGDLALEIVHELRTRGLRTTLTVVGARGRPLPAEVTHLERLEPQELSGVYATHDALLEPSRASAGGVVVTDALHHGLPVIASALGGLTDLVVDGVTGWLVPFDGTASPFVSTMETRVVTSDLPAMSRQAADWAMREASWPMWARAVRDALERGPHRPHGG